MAAAGAIPLLVKMLAPECSGWMKHNAASALTSIASQHAASAVTIAAVGAIPRLVQLLEPTTRTDPAAVSLCFMVQQQAACTLSALARDADIAIRIAASGAIQPRSCWGQTFQRTRATTQQML
jgi:hypothetical protein